MHVAPRTRRLITTSLDLPAAAYPILDELFADLTALGSAPRRVTNWLRSASLRPHHHILDLACGKGAVSIALAQSLHCTTLGIDAHEPFITAARTRAEQLHLSSRCTFRTSRVESFRPPRPPRFDAAIMLNLWPATRAHNHLRRFVKPRGLILIDDAVATRPTNDPDMPPTLDEISDQLTRTGDTILRTHIMTPSEVARHESALYARIARRAGAIIARNPRSRPLIREILQRQRDAARLLQGPIRPAMWLLRKA